MIALINDHSGVYWASRSEVCLNIHWFLTPADVIETMKAWLRRCNRDRPHGAIGHKPPIMLQNSSGAPSPPQ
ncbi:integrase core domain-containing protein [Azorhizobium doebereinerae]|uniref:integrase core domain-containing protein n=1 Tax=Azorhizobium doebereinerae TaxID=281091 RepID=UPI0012EB0C6B